jgi:hypothetical protein
MKLLDLIRDDWKHSDPTVRETAVANISDQSILIRIAKNDRELLVRQAAALKLSDLFSSALISAICRGTVEEITDEDVLAKFAKHAGNKKLAGAALQRLSDSKLINDVAEHGRIQAVRQAAVEMVTDQDVLARIAKQPHDDSLAVAAVGRVSDQACLTDIAAHSRNRLAAKAAVDRIQDEAILAQIAREADWAVGLAALARILDHRFVADVARHADSRVSHRAVDRINSRAVLAEIALKADNSKTREYALDWVRNPSVLAQLAKTDPDPSIRTKAQLRLDQYNHAISNDSKGRGSLQRDVPAAPQWFIKPYDVYRVVLGGRYGLWLYPFGAVAILVALYGGYSERSLVWMIAGVVLFSFFAFFGVFDFRQDMKASSEIKRLYRQQGLRFLDWLKSASPAKELLDEVRRVSQAQARADEIMRNGGPRTPEEYALLFPHACKDCCFRAILHVSEEWSQSYNDGYGEQTWGGWANQYECLRCGSRGFFPPLRVQYDWVINNWYEELRREAPRYRESIRWIYSPFLTIDESAAVPDWPWSPASSDVLSRSSR